MAFLLLHVTSNFRILPNFNRHLKRRNQKIFTSFDRSKATFKLMIVDACREIPTATLSLERITPLQLGKPPKGVALLQSCESGEYSFEWGKVQFGLFTYALLEGIRGAAEDKSGDITLLSWFDYTMKRTQELALDAREKQTPYVKGDFTNFVLVPRGTRRTGRVTQPPSPSYKSNFPDIFEAAKHGTKDDIQYFLDQGVSVNVKDKDDKTPLFFVSTVFYNTNNVETAKFLIEKGADVNAKDKNDRTPLHGCNSAEISKLLIENGADVNAQDEYGTTPLHHVKYNGDQNGQNVEIAKLLIEKGVDVNAKTKYNETPLHSILSGADISRSQDARDRRLEIVKLLIEKGADVNAEQGTWTNFKTPLSFATNLEIAKYLVENGANVNGGRSPLCWSPLLGVAYNVEIVKYPDSAVLSGG